MLGLLEASLREIQDAEVAIGQKTAFLQALTQSFGALKTEPLRGRAAKVPYREGASILLHDGVVAVGEEPVVIRLEADPLGHDVLADHQVQTRARRLVRHGIGR